jgi:predicted Fe-Mo cluster-binding NifX family protein
MTMARIAIPSTLPGGLEAQVSAHFGRCEAYTLVDVAGGLITQVGVLAAIPHEQGGCLAPVNHLASHGVTALIAGGMGMRPLMGFTQAGIQVFQGNEAARVETLVQAFLRGDLPSFTSTCSCGGHQH